MTTMLHVVDDYTTGDNQHKKNNVFIDNEKSG